MMRVSIAWPSPSLCLFLAYAHASHPMLICSVGYVQCMAYIIGTLPWCLKLTEIALWTLLRIAKQNENFNLAQEIHF